MKNCIRTGVLFSAAMLAGLMTVGCRHSKCTADDSLVGAWRGKVQFTTGAFAEVKDLEFMYVFNAGGTMTESSDYDASPPVPPAYGIWKEVGTGEFEAKYAFYWTTAPSNLDALTKGGGWSPGGHGVVSQRISLSEDGNSFTSTIELEMFDRDGKSTEAPSKATAEGNRIGF